MKHIPLFVFSIIFLFGILGMFYQLEILGITGNILKEKTIRVFIFPFSEENYQKIKETELIYLRHDFKTFFSADVEISMFKTLTKITRVEKTPYFYILGKQASEKKCAPTEKNIRNFQEILEERQGEGVSVSILDTGITEHKDLIFNGCKDTTNGKISDGCADDNGHGTHMAGIISAYGGKNQKGMIGIAPKTQINVIKVCQNNGICWADDVLAGLEYASKIKSNIILMSFGREYEINLFDNYFEKINLNDVILIAAAGKTKHNTLTYPATNPKIISVKIDGEFESDDADFTTPGINIESTWKDGCYLKLTGPSVSAAYMAGVATLLWQDNAFTTIENMKKILKNKKNIN